MRMRKQKLKAKNSSKFNIFLFEFATCGEKLDDSITIEGFAMFKSYYNGFNKISNVRAFVREEFSYLNLPVLSVEKIEEELERSDAFLIIAPEDDLILYKLTKIGEKHCYNLGSSSKAIKTTSDKWRLYKKLKGKVRIPRTSKRPISENQIIKPRISCGGSGIKFSRWKPENYIFQEYIRGMPLSVSLLISDAIYPVSVNEQIIENFRYYGAVVPARISSEISSEVISEAITASESIRGLNGYVGVDLVFSEEPYVIEINARPTTPSILFEFTHGISSAELIWRSQTGNLVLPRPKNRYRLHKRENSCDRVYASYGKYKLCIEEL